MPSRYGTGELYGFDFSALTAERVRQLLSVSHMREWAGPGVPFPQVQRRPDLRSSGPKRLMPRLQIKVPTISRWGEEMAVVIVPA